MPFIPHTNEELKQMLTDMGETHVAALFDEIPADLLNDRLEAIPEGVSEMRLKRLLTEQLADEKMPLCFIGAGAYEHHIPSAVWQVASRGEFLTAYTPYQAEASQGTLQLLYEYQTMMASLMGMDVSNASLYEGASALAEAILMAVRVHKGQRKRVIIPRSLHPYYWDTVKTIVSEQKIECVPCDFDPQAGVTDLGALSQLSDENLAAVVIPQPNFFGCLEPVDEMTDWAHQKNALAIACVNPMAMALLKEPGQWGSADGEIDREANTRLEIGADIACGEGQPLGVPLNSGGPYFGFLTCRQKFVRQMPGRLIGQTTDLDGCVGYTLTLQAREQHIRRSKATSNICTNQGLLVTAATIYMSLMGPVGLRQVAGVSHTQTKKLVDRLIEIDGVERVFDRPFFHECVLRLPRDVDEVLRGMSLDGIQAGLSLKDYFPELGDCLLVCVTETKTDQDLDVFVDGFCRWLG